MGSRTFVALLLRCNHNGRGQGQCVCPCYSVFNVELDSWKFSRQEPHLTSGLNDIFIALVAFALPMLEHFSGFDLDPASADWHIQGHHGVSFFNEMFLFVWGDGLVRLLKFTTHCVVYIKSDDKAQREATNEFNASRGVPAADNHAPVSTQVLFYLIGTTSSLMSPWLTLLTIGVMSVNLISIAIGAKYGAVNLNQTEVDTWLPRAMMACIWTVWLTWFFILVPLDKGEFGWRLGIVGLVLVVAIVIEIIVVKMTVKHVFTERAKKESKTASADSATTSIELSVIEGMTVHKTQLVAHTHPPDTTTTIAV